MIDLAPPATAPRPLFAVRHFRAEREADWQRLEALLDRIERRSARRLSEDDIVELPRLYRATLSALSIARETSLDAALVDYLEGLSTRAYFVLYSAREPWWPKIAGFFRHGWPSAIRGLTAELLIITALFFASAVAGYALVAADPAWFGALVSDEMASGRNMEATEAYLRSTLYDRPATGAGLEVFATSLFTHNSQVAILCFALGFAFGVPTLFLIAMNGALLGAFYAAFVPHGLGWNLTGWLSIHGTTEIFAILIAGAAGLHIGRAVAFPGARARLPAATEAGRRSARAMVGVVVMLLLAGLLEGFGRQLITSDGLRFGIAGSILTLWLVYFSVSGRDHVAR